MSYLIDTNVLSELVRPKPDKNVVAWFEHVPAHSLYLSVLTLGEIRKGVDKVHDKRRREKLKLWLEVDLSAWFGQRLLSVDVAVADRWGRLVAACQQPVPAIDSLLAATALHFDLALVTRNEKGFCFDGLEVINPWVFE